ncbi:MAG TPA: response regulator transcription factor [Burkholderiaceae bacterium]|jgi:DNA-binding response OmpR family regulator|nr:response regulator transcription factor [Burkholderiaceae bacterium]HRA79051.1 response regulator transcription factor [Burkholderiaceae bacterium]
MRVLLVEDDRMIGQAVQTALRQDGYAVDWVRDADTADTALATGGFDLVLLDLGLPGRDGVALLRAVRARRDATPVLIVTARDDVHDRVSGLDAGADDYLVKPFDLDELGARMRALLRRSAGRGESVFEHRGVRVDPSTREVSRDGEAITLSPREFAVLEALMLRPGAVLSRAQLEDRLYGWGESVESNAVEVYIHGLRRKLGHDFIQNVRGVGYFVPKADAQDEG